jgi:hypothetical protein
MATDFELNSKTVLDFEIDLNSGEFENFDWIQSLTKVIRVPTKCLKFRDITRKEAGRWWEIVWEDICCAGATTSFIALQCSNWGGQVARLRMRYKKAQ